MSGNLFVRSEGLQAFSQSHATVAQALPQSATDVSPGGVGDSHGPIAAAANTALNSALSARDGTVRSTTGSAGTIAELLQKAADAYERGDIGSAEELRAAADALAGEAGAGAGAGAAAGSGVGMAAGAGGGADMAGQMLGQIGGQVGQLAGMAMAPLQGLFQLPQQVMQGVQQAVQAATQAASLSSGVDAAALDEAATAALEIDDDEVDEDEAADRRDPDLPSERPRDGQAAAGPSITAGAAPTAAPLPEPAREESTPIRPPAF